ncbi:MAG: hypothetical protein H7296_09860 [Bacteroidia bacterium]|nr:hypothetical protein [Bacteroidia bacterium]
MTSLGDKAQTLLDTFNKADAAYTYNVNLRVESFKRLDKLLTYLKNSMENDEAPAELIADVKRLISKIKPATKTLKSITPTPPPLPGSNDDKKTKAREQKTFENKVTYFTELINLIELNEAYNPAEPDLSVESLTAYKDKLDSLNTTVRGNEQTLNEQRNSRDEMLQKGPDALLKVVDGVKLHVKHVFGENSNQYKQLVKFNFAG